MRDFGNRKEEIKALLQVSLNGDSPFSSLFYRREGLFLFSKENMVSADFMNNSET